jgi:hypothetical protein
MISNTYTVTTTRQVVVTAAPSSRTIYLHMLGNAVVYLGGADVTSANGMPTEKGAVPFEFFLPPNETLYAVMAAGTETLRVLRPSHDGT